MSKIFHGPLRAFCINADIDMAYSEKILIIDDVQVNLRLLGEILRNRFEILVATGGMEAIEIARTQSPDLILLDVMMPGMDGFSVCAELKKDELTAHIPIIFITSLNSMDDIVKGFEYGGVDYITKPFNPRELIARVNTHAELVRANKALSIYAESLEEVGRQLFNKTQELNETIERLNVALRTDTLTGLANRTHINERIKEEIAHIKSGGNIFSLVLVDIDYFKAVNDTHGHECGDHALREVSSIMSTMMREQDVISRWGGEEYLLFLPETDTPVAAILAERLRERIESTPIEYRDMKLALTITIGVTSFDPELGIDGSIKKADQALYEGKRTGRNRVVIHK